MRPGWGGAECAPCDLISPPQKNIHAKLRGRIGRLAVPFVMQIWHTWQQFFLNQMASSLQNVNTFCSILQCLDKSGPVEITKQPTVLSKLSGVLWEPILHIVAKKNHLINSDRSDTKTDVGVTSCSAIRNREKVCKKHYDDYGFQISEKYLRKK